MKRFKSPGQAQRCLATHDHVANLFRTPATTADHRRQMRQQAHAIWADLAGVAVA